MHRTAAAFLAAFFLSSVGAFAVGRAHECCPMGAGMTCSPAALGGSLELCGIRSCSHEPEAAGAISFGPALLPISAAVIVQLSSELHYSKVRLVDEIQPPGPPSPPPRS